VVADGRGDEWRDGVRILDAGKPRGRLSRMLWATRRVLELARQLDADVYQLHDPELLPAGLRLHRLGKQVVFDAHEDVPTQLLNKPYLGSATTRLLSRGYALYERYACRRLDGLLAATPHIGARLASLNRRTVDINNFPLSQEFDADGAWEERTRVCYVGSISAIRGIRELVSACALLRSPARLALAGDFAEPALEAEVATLPGWERIDPLGHLDRRGVAQVMRRSFAGLVTLLPTPSYRESLPVKMFEYMAAGIPVIASDFPLWRGIVEDSDCGLCVDPRDPLAIAAAIDRLAADPALAQRLGANGRRAVAQKYSWNREAEKLTRFYASLLSERLSQQFY
jgi:glycosyltransferase involved in cell wall biosynthesis